MISRLAITRSIADLRQDETGATLTEFAFVWPVLILLVMGVFDAAHTAYTASLVNGAMQKAARDLTLENAGSQQQNIDDVVETSVRNVVPGSSTITFEKLSHFDFSDVGEPEAFTDDNDDGICNDNEPFEDSNNNGQWDADRGASGIGGARDAVLYTVTVTYPRLFPMAGLAGLPDTVSVSSATVLRNQPYDEQDRTVTVGNCT